ncbi:rhomboid family intramembrane serine protease [Streptomyces sp. NPDC002004]
MSPHGIELYASAAVVVGAGLRTLVLFGPASGPAGGTAGRGPRQNDVLAAVRGAWAQRPWGTAVLFALMAVMAVVQYAVPGVVDDLMRRPGALTDGQWWRAGTALLVQSSGIMQIAVNLSALLVVGAIAESVFGWWRTLAVFLVGGVAAHVVSLAGWSLYGGGDSVAICGLLGALAVTALLRRDALGLTFRSIWYVLLIPAAGLFLCLLRNNHGAGLVAGCLCGLLLVGTEVRLPRPAAV